MHEEPDSLPRLRKRLGQVFLRSPGAIAGIVSALNLKQGDIVLEIGAGDGRLSARIAPLVKRLYANELDERFLEVLGQRFANTTNVTIVPGDILAEETVSAVWRAEPRVGLVVYGSLPYYIASPILRWVLDHSGRIRRASLLVQREVAQRVVSAPGSRRYGFISVLMQRRSNVDLGPLIKRGAFQPVPKVDSQLLHIAPRALKNPDKEQRFEHFISGLFQYRRKKISTSFKASLGKELTSALKGRAEAEGLSLDARPEHLSPEQLDRLFQIVESLRS